MNSALTLGGALAAFLLLVMGGKKAAAKAPGTPTGPTAPPPVTYPTAPPGTVPTPTGAGSVAERMAAVLATGNPQAIRFEAARLRQEGFITQALQLEQAATELEAGLTPPPAPPPVVAPGGVYQPPVVAPPVMPPVVLPPIVVPPPVVPVVPPVVPAPPASTVPTGAPWVTGVPAQLQGLVLRRVSPEVFDQRVVIWQDRLTQLGFRKATHSDGFFGPKTETETKAFQSARGLTPTGVVDSATLAAAVDMGPPAPPVAPGAPTVWIVGVPAELQGITAAAPLKRTSPTAYDRRSELVQMRLAELGYLKPTDVDGHFGPGTESAVKAFQTRAGLGVDGKVGPGTLAALANAGAVRMQGDEMFGYDVAPPVPQPATPLPGLIPPMLPPDPDPRKALAARVSLMLFGAPPGQEDRTMIQNFQAQEGLKASGFYGPATAEALAMTYGIVPPKPRFWSKKHQAKAKANYRAMLKTLGSQDPQRVEEWKQAADV